MDDRILIAASRIDPDGETIEGEADAIDLDGEEYVKPFGGIRYRLDVQLFGTELLVRGHLEQDFTLVCSRCGEDFDTTIEVDDFTTSIDVSDGREEVDLTADARESIILALPNFPVCDEACRGILPERASVDDARWSALDGLDLSGAGDAK